VGTALVTGASSGIGKELARRFAADGHAVVLVARRLALLEALAAELRSSHQVDVWPVACDLTAQGGVDNLLRELATRELRIDFLVNSAGVGTTGPFAESVAERELAMAELNVMAVVHLTHALLPGMLARGQGRILNIGSTAGFQPGPYMATYYASKAFMNHFSEALAHELAGSGVTVTLSCPGPTRTEFGEVAGFGNRLGKAFERMSMTPDAVVRKGLAALDRNRSVVVTGAVNKVGAQATRFLPRSWLRRITAAIKD
jgi:short-subunit dehydrogenase